MFHIDSGLFKLCFPSPHRKVLFCYATISERLSCVRFLCTIPRVWPGLFTGLWTLPPAPIQSLSSDSDSALPTLCLKLVIELCLSDLHTLLIKLHMDPNAPDSALQKTSPDIDPAVFYRFHHGSICSSDRTCYPATTAEPPYLSHGGAGKVSASSSSPSTQHERFSAESTNARTRFLRSYCHKNQLDWSRYLLWAEYAQNSIRKPSTGITPFQCVLGFQPPLFPWSGESSELPAVNSLLQRSEETWNEAQVHLQRAIHRTREQANRHRRANPNYQPGQWVWLSTRDLRLRLPCKKLSPRYVGPFKIIRQITPVSFRLALPAHYRISPTFHVSLLKHAGGPRGEEVQDEAGDQRAPPIIVDGQGAYQVREILDSRRRGRFLQYLIDWEGYGPEERSWVNADDILDPSLTTDYHRDHPDRPAPRPRGRPRVVCLLTSGAAHRGGGALSRTQPLWLPPIATRGNRHPSINCHELHFPYTLYLWLITCTGVPYWLWSI